MRFKFHFSFLVISFVLKKLKLFSVVFDLLLLILSYTDSYNFICLLTAYIFIFFSSLTAISVIKCSDFMFVFVDVCTIYIYMKIDYGIVPISRILSLALRIPLGEKKGEGEKREKGRTFRKTSVVARA